MAKKTKHEIKPGSMVYIVEGDKKAGPFYLVEIQDGQAILQGAKQAKAELETISAD